MSAAVAPLLAARRTHSGRLDRLAADCRPGRATQARIARDWPLLCALAESFVDSFKTELIADRVWRNRSQLELDLLPAQQRGGAPARSRRLARAL
jgi:hypothetical protein